MSILSEAERREFYELFSLETREQCSFSQNFDSLKRYPSLIFEESNWLYSSSALALELQAMRLVLGFVPSSPVREYTTVPCSETSKNQ